jgi:hypothetical protein
LLFVAIITQTTPPSSILLLLFRLLFNINMETIGEYHAIWLVVFVERDRVAALLERETTRHANRSFTLTSHFAHALPSASVYPVVLELGREHDCGPSLSFLMRSSFLEFKLEIPYVLEQVADATQPIERVFKASILMNNRINVMASNALMGITSYVCSGQWDESTTHNGDMHFRNTSTSCSGSSATAASSTDERMQQRGHAWLHYQPVDSEFQPLNDTMQELQRIMDSSWFASNSSNHSHVYDWQRARMRPCSATLVCGDDVFLDDEPLLKAGQYQCQPLSAANVWGAVEVRAPFRIAKPPA